MLKQYFRTNQDEYYSPDQFSSPGGNECGFFSKLASNNGDDKSDKGDQDRSLDNLYIYKTEAHSGHKCVNTCGN